MLFPDFFSLFSIIRKASCDYVILKYALNYQLVDTQTYITTNCPTGFK